MLKYGVGIIALFLSCHLQAEGNTLIDSFSKAKKYMLNEVYFDHRTTLYCRATSSKTKQ